MTKEIFDFYSEFRKSNHKIYIIIFFELLIKLKKIKCLKYLLKYDVTISKNVSSELINEYEMI